MTRVDEKEYCLANFRYDPETGAIWRARDEACKPIGCKQSKGYLVVRASRNTVLNHRVAWLLTHGDWPSVIIDHVDGDPTNNRLSNLRAATFHDNMGNARRRVDNSSGFKGVYFNRQNKNWVAQIRVAGKSAYLGSFKSPEAAHAAYLRAAERVFGEFARAA